MKRYRTAAAAITLGVLVAVLGGEWPHAFQNVSTDFLITHVRVFDGAPTLSNTQVAVTGGIIRAVGRDLAAWRQLPTIDGSGSTLVPGLIDAHAHVVDGEELRRALRFGVTTVLDMATVRVPERDVFALRSAANVSPDMASMRSAGFPATAPGAHGTEYGLEFPTVGTVAAATAFVAMRRVEGSDYLKVMLNGARSATSGIQNLDEPRVRALVDAAHASGMLAVAHIETLDDAAVAVSAGIDGLVHAWRSGGPNPAMARRLVDRHVFVAPTLAVRDGFLPDGRASLLADRRFQAVLSNTIQEQLHRPSSDPSPTDVLRAELAASIATVRGLHRAGVRLVVGTDARDGYPSHGISVHRELELFRQAGLAPSEVLAAATMNTAEAFRLDDRGRILPSRRADLILVRGDPTSDLLSVRDIARIWKAGVEVDRTAATR